MAGSLRPQPYQLAASYLGLVTGGHFMPPKERYTPSLTLAGLLNWLAFHTDRLVKGRQPPVEETWWPPLISTLHLLPPALAACTPPEGVDPDQHRRLETQVRTYLEKISAWQRENSLHGPGSSDAGGLGGAGGAGGEGPEEARKLRQEKAELEERLREAERQHASCSTQWQLQKLELQRTLDEAVEEAGREREEGERRLQQLGEEKERQAASLATLLHRAETRRAKMAARAASLQQLASRLQSRLQQARQESARAEKESTTLASRLEREMQLAEDFRRQLEVTSEARSLLDYQSQIREALARVERREREASDVTLRSAGAECPRDSFMERLPEEVKVTCLKIQRFVGGEGRRFAEALLGRHVAWCEEDLQQGGFFFSPAKFWRCVQSWQQRASLSADPPLSLDHLLSACRALRVDPTSRREMAAERERVLEDHFAYLADNLRVVEVLPYLRDSSHVTGDAWELLLQRGSAAQQVDRLLAVLYSLGEDGYWLLIAALHHSWNQHLLVIFPREDVEKVTGQGGGGQPGPGHSGGRIHG